ncbi:hypothetical protein [Elizabethkingia meningoseptica]|uniref:hypothetical protein n=1 Tax=Elizabethkingia meningoseptica TaxID=238 RepID=UPI003891E58B
MEIDSTPMAGIQKDKYKELLKLDRHFPLFAVAIGYRSTDDYNQPSMVSKSRVPLNRVIQSI